MRLQKSTCQQKVLRLSNTRLKLSIKTPDREAVHRLLRRQADRKTLRGIIIRFISRGTRDEVLYKRGNLREIGIVLVKT